MLSEFEKFGFSITFVVFAIMALIAYPALKAILKILIKQYNQFNRPQQKGIDEGQKKPSYTRKTDIFEQLSAEQKKIHQQAEQLVARNEIQQAAQLFEQINFTRRAIDELEKAGFVDAACAILLRMNAVQRAAIVYERNGRLEKAAKIYIQVQQFAKAAEAYKTLSAKNFLFLEPAAQCFGMSGDLKSQIDCLTLLGQIVKVVDICRENNRYDLLITSLGNPIFFESALETLQPKDMVHLIDDMPLNPLAIVNVCLWLSLAKADFFPMSALLQRVQQNDGLMSFFWHVLCEKLDPIVLARQNWKDTEAQLEITLRSFQAGVGKAMELAYLQRLLDSIGGQEVSPVQNTSLQESEDAVVFDLKLAS